MQFPTTTNWTAKGQKCWAQINTLYEVLYRVVLRASCCSITVPAGVGFLWLTDSSLNSEALRSSLIALEAGGLPSLTLWLASPPPPHCCPPHRGHVPIRDKIRLRQTIRVSLVFRFHRVNFFFCTLYFYPSVYWFESLTVSCFFLMVINNSYGPISLLRQDCFESLI